jgi:hypothetical protein
MTNTQLLKYILCDCPDRGTFIDDHGDKTIASETCDCEVLTLCVECPHFSVSTGHYHSHCGKCGGMKWNLYT